MKGAASEAGIDPRLVERAAHLVAAHTSSSLYERLIGGPARQGGAVRLPVKLDEARAAQLLDAVRMIAEESGTGHASASGMVWLASNDLEALKVTARPVEDGTAVAVDVDRSGLLAFMHVAGLIGSVAAAGGGIALADQVAPIAGLLVGVGGVGGIVTAARTYWKASTARINERINDVMDAVGRAAGSTALPASAQDTDDAGDPSRPA